MILQGNDRSKGFQFIKVSVEACSGNSNGCKPAGEINDKLVSLILPQHAIDYEKRSEKEALSWSLDFSTYMPMSSSSSWSRTVSVSPSTIDFPFSSETTEFLSYEPSAPVITPDFGSVMRANVYFEASKIRNVYGKERQRTFLLLAELGGLLMVVATFGFVVTRILDCKSLERSVMHDSY